VVDDDPVVAATLIQAARSWNYRCQTARNVDEALRLFARSPTPILVTDLYLCGAPAVRLVEETHRRWPSTAIIVLTACQDCDAAIQCLNAGASRYFIKPIKVEEFRHVLTTSLRTYELQREHDTYHRRLEQTVRRQTRQLRHHFLATINSLVMVLEARDPYTSGHSRRVRQYALLLGQAAGLERRARQALGLAAKLHDLGKIGVPEAVLNKPAFLTQEEFEIVREHPIISERILAPVIRNREVLAAIRGHHERLDGLGYPDGLTGEQVPLLARLLAIADCFDALTSARSYRRPLPVPQAFEVLRERAGTQFDAEFVRIFIEMIETLPLEKATAVAQIAQ
jgi:response regulator RpfG family c-di-GMP phosphodiesterase